MKIPLLIFQFGANCVMLHGNMQGDLTMKDLGKTDFVLGIDYGTDSCRAVVIDPKDGAEIAQAVAAYPRWAQGLFCSPAGNRFRQHPLDYVESLETAMAGLNRSAGPEVLKNVKGIAIDTTGSTPCAVTREGRPLALLDEFKDDPDAMFILWKDHTSTEEAALINHLARTWGGTDYTKYEGGIYSSEWFWAKAMHVLSTNPKVAGAAYSFLEHCDWMPALLTGCSDIEPIKRSRCAMGHKAMWHEEFGGYPSVEFLSRLSAPLAKIQPTLGTKTYTSDQTFGYLSEEWAKRLHLSAGIPVAVGAFDAHMGAVGGGVRPGVLVKVMGTSTCDMIVAPKDTAGEHLVRGICGQVDGSIIPSMLGYEAGQSAFGDVYAWFKKLLMWPLESLAPELLAQDSLAGATSTVPASPAASTSSAASAVPDLIERIDGAIMANLEREAEKIDPADSSLIALDWLNGRRTPDANQLLKGAITGLTLGTTAPMIYRALIESTAFGTKAIVERFKEEGVAIDRIVAIGGVAKKSRLVMQIVADVLDAPIDIAASDQSVALGAAMFASVVAGIHPSITEAQKAISSKIEKTVNPDPARARLYAGLYERYRKLGAFIECELT